MNMTMQLSESLRIASKEMADFTINLTVFSESLGKKHPREGKKLERILNQGWQIKQLIDQLEVKQSLTLMGQDYTNFCLLIFYGGLMTDYMFSMKKINPDSLRHANQWKGLAVKFKPFFQKKIVA